MCVRGCMFCIIIIIIINLARLFLFSLINSYKEKKNDKKRDETKQKTKIEMFIRFEPIKRPQSYNDNPITSLSWMINDCSQNNNNNNVNTNNNLNDDENVDQISDNNNNNNNVDDGHQHYHHHHHHHNHDDEYNDDNGIQFQQQQLQPEALYSYPIDNHHHHHQHHQQHHNHRHQSLQQEHYYQSFDNNNDNDNGQNEILDGWLAIGNCRGVVGVSYTTIDSLKIQNFKRQINNNNNNDDDEDNQNNFMTLNQSNNQHQNQNQSSSSTTAAAAAIIPQRTNFNLRGHRSEIIFVRWNEPYQKLASCDRNGVIFVWIKYEGRWSIELINDRNTRVTDFAWSHDGRMALICYMDGFVLVGSVSGQRYWSSMLNLNGCSITCGTWTANNQHVLFGTSNGHILGMIIVLYIFITYSSDLIQFQF